MLLKHADAQRPVRVAEQIRHDVRNLAVTVTATSGDRVLLTGISASVGVTTHPPDNLGSLRQLVLAADSALQQAKQHGRDQVRTVAGPSDTDEQAVVEAHLIQHHSPAEPLSVLDHNTCLQHLLNFSHMMSGQWNPDVLLALSTGPRRYTDLLATIRTSTAVDGWSGRTRHIQDSILNRTLRRLERDGLIFRTEEPGVWPRSVHYELSPAAHELLKAVIPGVLWSHRHQDLIVQAQQRTLARAG